MMYTTSNSTTTTLPVAVYTSAYGPVTITSTVTSNQGFKPATVTIHLSSFGTGHCAKVAQLSKRRFWRSPAPDPRELPPWHPRALLREHVASWGVSMRAFAGR